MADQNTIWRYVPAAEYAVPSDLSTETLRGFRRVWKGAVAAVRSPKDAKDEQQERRQPSAEVLTDLLPVFDAEAVSHALAAALDDRADLDSVESQVQLVIGPPGSHVKEVVTALARRRGWRELAPPARADLLGSADPIRDRLNALLPEPNRRIVIPKLERWFVRSERGLPLLRSLLERLRGMLSPVLVGCDSWAWSFLDHTVGVGDLLGEPLTLAALDAQRLASWLGPPLQSKGFVCRSAENRNEGIFGPLVDQQVEKERDSPPVSGTLVRLASTARGNPGVALELWKRSLCLEPDDRDRADEETNGQRNRLWTAPLHGSDVVIPPQLEAVHKFLLHAVLLHGGLERDLLTEVLPFPRHDLLRRIRDVVNEGLLEERDGELSVPTVAYTAVRGYLEGEGFLADEF